MLHILLLILKIIGYILLTVLGIALLLILLILFTPLKYDIYGQVNNSKESLAGKVKFKYIFGILNGQFVFKDGRPRYYVAVFKKKIVCSKKPKEETEDYEYQSSKTPNKSAEDKMETSKRSESKKQEDDFRYVTTEDLKIEDIEQVKSKADDSFKASKEEKASKQKKPKKKCDINKKLNSIIDKIKNIYNKIYDKIKIIKENKAVIDKFFNDKIHKKAIHKVFKEIKVLLMKLKPYDLKGNLQYGFEDPALTGKVLAVYSMASPFIGGDLNVMPLFDNELFYKGNISFKGKIRPSYFVSAIIKLAVRKCMWSTFKDTKTILDDRKIGGN